MGLMSRRKGRAWEQRVATDLRKAFPKATVRRSLQAHHASEPDVVIEGDAPDHMRYLWLECHDARAPQPLEKLAQAERDCRRAAILRIPVVVWHRTGARTAHATLRLDALMVLIGAPFQPADFSGIPVTCDWAQLLDVLRQPAQTEAR